MIPAGATHTRRGKYYKLSMSRREVLGYIWTGDKWCFVEPEKARQVYKTGEKLNG
jgi:hypothetical protein